jgi:hypothetical protein
MTALREHNKNTGSALLLTIIVLSLFVSISAVVVNIVLSELRINKDMADSVIAFYVADTAVENVLIEARREPTPTTIPSTSVSLFLSLEDSYAYATATVEIIDLTIGASTRSARIKANGRYKDTNRAIEVLQPL